MPKVPKVFVHNRLLYFGGTVGGYRFSDFLGRSGGWAFIGEWLFFFALAIGFRVDVGVGFR